MIEVFYGARLFDGERLNDDAALVCEDERIVALAPYAERPRAGRQHDLGGGVLAPGLIDWQVNGGGGVLFNETPEVDGIAAIVAAHRRFGTTSLLPTLITDAPAVLATALAAAREANGRIAGALGIHVEGPFIDPRRKGAHPAQFIRPMTEGDADALIAARAGACVVTVAPAAVSAALIARLARAGIVVSVGHAECSFDEAASAFDAGARATTHVYNAMSQLGHRQPGLVGASLSDERVICGLIADGVHVHDAAMRVALKAKGPRGIALISDAMPPAAGGPDRFTLHGRAIVREGVTLTNPDGTLAGAAITLLEAVRHLVRAMDAPLAAALQMATLTPARLLGLDHAIGRLAPGCRADLLHVDDALAIRGVWIGGEPVAEADAQIVRRKSSIPLK
jgi:N-acetylglucosamine-6-phosphate deacetylase